MLMGVRAEGLACAHPVARTPIGLSRNCFISFLPFLSLCVLYYSVLFIVLWCLYLSRESQIFKLITRHYSRVLIILNLLFQLIKCTAHKNVQIQGKFRLAYCHFLYDCLISRLNSIGSSKFLIFCVPLYLAGLHGLFLYYLLYMSRQL